MASENQEPTNDEAVSYTPTHEETNGYTPFRTLWAIVAFIFGRRLHITALTVVILTLTEALITFLLTMGGAQVIPRVGGTLTLVFTFVLLLLLPHAIYWGYRLFIYPILWLISLMFISEGRAWRAGDLRTPARITLSVMNAFYYRLTNRVASNLVSSWDSHPKATTLIGAVALTAIFYPLSFIGAQGSPIHIAFLSPLVFLFCSWLVSLVGNREDTFIPNTVSRDNPIAKLLPKPKSTPTPLSTTSTPPSPSEATADSPTAAGLRAEAQRTQKEHETYAKTLTKKLATEVEWLRNHYAPVQQFRDPKTKRVLENKRTQEVLKNIISVEVLPDEGKDPAPQRATPKVVEAKNKLLKSAVKIVLNVENDDRAFAKKASNAIKNRLHFASVVRPPQDFGGTVELIAYPTPPPTIDLTAIYPYPYNDVAPSLTSIPFGVKSNGHENSIALHDQHILLAGQTGAGKSTALQAILAGVAQVKNTALFVIDPKKVELSLWADRVSFYASTFAETDQLTLFLYAEMEKRYEWLQANGYESVSTQMVADGIMSHIVVVIDELAAITNYSPKNADEKNTYNSFMGRMEDLLQRSRSAGMTFIMATQTPNVDVIPSVIRNNLTVRIALRTATRSTTEMILGEYDPDQLRVKPEEITSAQRGLSVVKYNGLSLVKSYYLPKPEIRQWLPTTASLRVDDPFFYKALKSVPELEIFRKNTAELREAQQVIREREAKEATEQLPSQVPPSQG